jgi:hypothetical protein
MGDGFTNSHEAIGWALRRVRTPIYDRPSIWELGRKTAGRDFLPGLNEWDKVAEAALILKNLERHCTSQHQAVILTYFTGGTVRETGVLIEYLAKQFHWDRWFVMEIVLNWAKGKRMRHTTEWWAKKYGVNQSTITRRTQKIKERLDELFGSGMGIAHDALVDSGHIEIA